jgi:zinc D-Ala-D-Ala dipeptidase
MAGFRYDNFDMLPRLIVRILERCLPLILIALGACQSPRTLTEPPAARLFQIHPTRPIDELRREALQASPPLEKGDFLQPDLVELSGLDPTLQFDIRYATDHNFLGVPVYQHPMAFLQRPAAMALLAAHRELASRKLGLLIFDAYRPWYVTKIFWDATPADLKEYVANPDNGSRHNRGCAVDLTLYDLVSGQPLPMPSGYDEFSERAHLDFQGGSEQARTNRDLLQNVMRKHGFLPYASEWWHFDFHDWRKYPILNISFEELDSPQAP